MDALKDYSAALNKAWVIFRDRWSAMDDVSDWVGYWDKNMAIFSELAREHEGKPEHAFVSDFCVACLSQLQRRARGLINEN